MDPSTRRDLRGTFDAAAKSYAAARPSYPGAAVAFLLGDHDQDVLDLGAGSGALTRLLHRQAARVIAAEPSTNLLQALRESSPDAAVVEAGAEHLPFAGASFDVVTVATAFHWFDPIRALPEIARVLRLRGHLGLVWNTRIVNQGWTAEFDGLLRSAQPSTLQGDWGTGSVRVLSGHPLFTEPDYAEFAHVQQLDKAGLLDLVASRSYVIALSPEAHTSLLDRASALFASAADDSGHVQMPYVAKCWRAAVRRPSAAVISAAVQAAPVAASPGSSSAAAEPA